MMWRNLLEHLRVRPLENLHLRLIAVGLAFLFWAQVNAGLAVPHIVPNVPIVLENLPSDLALADSYTDTIVVRVRGPAARTRTLAAGEMSPVIDLFGVHAGENFITLQPEDIPVPFGIEVERVDPAEIRLVLEERARATLPIRAVVEGDPAPGFVVGEKTVTPLMTTVSGPRSMVESLESLPTEAVNISGRQTALTRNVAVRTERPLVTLDTVRSTRLAIEILEATITAEIEEIPVELIEVGYRLALNPETIGVVIRGPGSIVSQISAANITAVIDPSGLRPRREDYLLEPQIDFQPQELAAQVELVALTPQRRLNLHVFDQPPR